MLRVESISDKSGCILRIAEPFLRTASSKISSSLPISIKISTGTSCALLVLSLSTVLRHFDSLSLFTQIASLSSSNKEALISFPSSVEMDCYLERLVTEKMGAHFY